MVSEGASCKYVNGKSSVYNTTACCRATFLVLLWMLQDTSHEVYVYIGCAPKLYLDVRTFALYGADTPKQDAACYCEFYWTVNFVVHDTVTISPTQLQFVIRWASPRIYHHRDKIDTTADPRRSSDLVQ